MAAIAPIGPQVRIRSFRVAVGLTLEQLAERIEAHGVPVSVPHLSRVERGLERVSDRLLRAWALALGIDPLDVGPSTTAPATVPEPRVADATVAA